MLESPLLRARYSQNLKEKTGHMKQMTQELEMYHNQAGVEGSGFTSPKSRKGAQAETVHDGNCGGHSQHEMTERLS